MKTKSLTETGWSWPWEDHLPSGQPAFRWWLSPAVASSAALWLCDSLDLTKAILPNCWTSRLKNKTKRVSACPFRMSARGPARVRAFRGHVYVSGRAGALLMGLWKDVGNRRHLHRTPAPPPQWRVKNPRWGGGTQQDCRLTRNWQHCGKRMSSTTARYTPTANWGARSHWNSWTWRRPQCSVTASS